MAKPSQAKPSQAKPSQNERITENIVRDNLRHLGYYDPDNGITVEEQKSEIAKVKALLSKAGKNGKGNAGYPEFIVSNRKDTNFLIVFECKPDVRKHESPARDRPIEYAVDGVLHYAGHLSKHYTVLAVAVSGSVLETFVQPEPFYSGRDLYFLRPVDGMGLEEKLYYCMCIRANKYRYNYGRQANRTLRDILIPSRQEIPAWVYPTLSDVVADWKGLLETG